MLIFLTTLLASLASIFRSRASLGLENLALRIKSECSTGLQESAQNLPRADRQLWILSAPRSPWQRAYIERVIGSVRRECLDHMIVSMKPLYDELLLPISITITDRERIFRWGRTHRSHERFTRPKWDPS